MLTEFREKQGLGPGKCLDKDGWLNEGTTQKRFRVSYAIHFSFC